MTKIWKLGCGNEVKGEGYILNLILYSFFRVFPIFDPRVPFHFSLAARIYKKEFSNLHPSPFGDSFDDQRVKGEGTFLFCIKHFFAFGYFKESLVGNGEI